VFLIEALRYQKNSVVSFVGAGGKSAALFIAARELSIHPESKTQKTTVLVTTTTHLGAWQVGMADHVWRIKHQSDIRELEKKLPTGIVLLIGDEINHRVSGLPYPLLEEVRNLAVKRNLALLIEADGSGGRPLKAPVEHEPAIPAFSDQVVVVAGLRGLSKPLTSEWVHRPERYAHLSGLNLGDEITIEAMVSVLGNSDGGLKNIPPQSRRILLLNQADTVEIQSHARKISDRLKRIYDSTVIASLQLQNNKFIEVKISKEQVYKIHAVLEPTAGIVLAAGGSSRFGKPKQLLLWNELPIIRHVIDKAMQAGLDVIVVVVGSFGEEIVNCISDLAVRIANNTEWMTGVSSSIRTGMEALPADFGAVIFFQADQPQVSRELIHLLVEKHHETLCPITAPQINGQPGNPVLFDKSIFPELMTLVGDTGGKALFSRFPVHWVDWPDPSQTLDIDTPQDYKKFLEMFPESKENR
jgi:molybdenum cofactor cytidylyltransferase